MLVCEHSLQPAMTNGAKTSAFQLYEKIWLSFELYYEWTILYFAISLKKNQLPLTSFCKKGSISPQVGLNRVFF